MHVGLAVRRVLFMCAMNVGKVLCWLAVGRVLFMCAMNVGKL